MEQPNEKARPAAEQSVPQKTTAPTVPTAPITVKLDGEGLDLVRQIADRLDQIDGTLSNIEAQLGYIAVLMP